MIKMAVLGSGSSGNATLVQCGDTRILVDAGLSAKQLVLRLDLLGVSADEIDAILITHEHSDHARGIDVLLRNRSIPVYANTFTHEVLESKMKSKIDWKIFRSGQDFEVGEMNIKSFKIQHDAAEPVGFVVNGRGVQLGLATDVGFVTNTMRESLRGSHALYIEANYDETLLERDTKRPWSTKQRIASRHGHLSNTQTAEFLHEIACEKLGAVMLCHLSSDCNTPELAISTVRDSLATRDITNVSIHCSEQHEPTAWIHCGSVPE